MAGNGNIINSNKGLDTTRTRIEHMMDQQDRGSVSEIDLESGGTTDEDVGDEGGDINPILSGVNHKKRMQRAWSKVLGKELLDGSDDIHSSHSPSRVSISDEIFVENERKQTYTPKEVNGNVFYKKMTHEKPKKPNSTRHPKPPRPPRGLSLDAADTRLAKEVSELAILKRKRADRLKALQKAVRKEKASSMSSASIGATVVTVLFFLVIIFPGFLGTRS